MMKVCLLFLALLASTCYAVDKTVVSQRLGVIGDYLVTSVGIGSKPTQFFDLYLDSSDDKLVVLDIDSANAAIDFQYDYIKNLFTQQASDSFKPLEQICRRGYYDGQYMHYVDGKFGTDLITLGGNTFEKNARLCNLKPNRTGITSYYNDPIKWYMGLPIDGFFGVKPGGEDILQKIGLTVRQLSLFVDPKAIQKEPDNAGFITFGGPDTDHCGSFKNIFTEDEDSWRTMVSTVTFNGKTIKGTYSTRFEFHNKTLILPQDVYSAVSNYFGGTSNINCQSHSNAPDMTLSIYGKDYKFPISSVLKPMTSSSSCRVDIGISSATDVDQIVLNRHILDKYCLLLDFENGEIGFADFKNSNN